jgi:poly-beta-1,6-N-acetyl-D-glucosamine synthase
MNAKKIIIRLMYAIPFLVEYIYPVDKSIHGKGVLIPACSSRLLSPVSGSVHFNSVKHDLDVKKGETVLEINYSNAEDMMTFGMRKSQINETKNEINLLRRQNELLTKLKNDTFADEHREIREDLALKERLLDDLKQPWSFFEATEKSIRIIAPEDGFILRTNKNPLDGEIVSAGQELGTFVNGNDLRIIVLYPYTELPNIGSKKEFAEIKIPGLEGHYLKMRGFPLTEPVMGGELFQLLNDTTNYMVKSSATQEKIKDSFGIIYEIKNIPIDTKLLLGQEVESVIKRPFSLLVTCWFHYSWLSWHIFINQLSREPFVAIQSGLFTIGFWLVQPYIVFSFIFSGVPAWEIRKRFKESQEAVVPKKPLSVSVVVPFYNEGLVILSTIESLARQEYPVEQIIFVDDGSTDNVFEIISEKFRLRKEKNIFFLRRGPVLKEKGRVNEVYSFEYLEKKFLLIRKENAGKGNALNCALNRLNSDFVVTLDADTILDRDSLVVLLYSVYKNPSVKVVHGRLGVMNNCVVKDGAVIKKSLPRGFIELCQVVEYFEMFINKSLYNALNSHLVIVGAFACYNAKTLKELGGFYQRTIVEDQDIAYEIHRKMVGKGNGPSILYVPQAVAWTQVPYNHAGLLRQRLRWYGGTLETMAKHKDMVFNPKYHWMGLFLLPNMWLGVFTFWIHIATDITGFLGLTFNMILFASSSVWRSLFHFNLAYFFLPWLILSHVFIILDYWFVDRKYIKTWNSPQYLIMILFSKIGYMFYNYMITYYQTVGYLKALFKKLSWDTIERKEVRT